MSPPITKRTR